MRTLKIDFTSAKLLPNGNDAGYIGEHNATELVITPPAEMTECESIATYIVAFATNRGVLYSNSFLKSEEITVPLTSSLTTDYYLGVQLEGYDSEGELVVKSPLVTQLQFSPSARGTGSETDGGTINGSIPSADGHSHSNKNVLDLIGQNGNTLTFNGNNIIGSAEVDLSLLPAQIVASLLFKNNVKTFFGYPEEISSDELYQNWFYSMEMNSFLVYVPSENGTLVYINDETYEFTKELNVSKGTLVIFWVNSNSTLSYTIKGGEFIRQVLIDGIESIAAES